MNRDKMISEAMEHDTNNGLVTIVTKVDDMFQNKLKKVCPIGHTFINHENGYNCTQSEYPCTSQDIETYMTPIGVILSKASIDMLTIVNIFKKNTFVRNCGHFETVYNCTQNENENLHNCGGLEKSLSVIEHDIKYEMGTIVPIIDDESQNNFVPIGTKLKNLPQDNESYMMPIGVIPAKGSIKNENDHNCGHIENVHYSGQNESVYNCIHFQNDIQIRIIQKNQTNSAACKHFKDNRISKNVNIGWN